MRRRARARRRGQYYGVSIGLIPDSSRMVETFGGYGEMAEVPLEIKASLF